MGILLGKGLSEHSVSQLPHLRLKVSEILDNGVNRAYDFWKVAL
jgi:hypothetical protein